LFRTLACELASMPRLAHFDYKNHLYDLTATTCQKARVFGRDR
jgi:hypothetical protein